MLTRLRRFWRRLTAPECVCPQCITSETYDMPGFWNGYHGNSDAVTALETASRRAEAFEARCQLLESALRNARDFLDRVAHHSARDIIAQADALLVNAGMSGEALADEVTAAKARAAAALGIECLCMNRQAPLMGGYCRTCGGLLVERDPRD